MKFSVLRSQKEKEVKEVSKLLKKISSLNEHNLNCSFEVNKTDLSIIYSNLKRSDLPCLKLPEHAYYKSNYLQTYDHGFAIIVYKGKDYTFYAKGCGSK